MRTSNLAVFRVCAGKTNVLGAEISLKLLMNLNF
jgi:hypothetical protein